MSARIVPADQAMEEAVARIRSGQLVAIPTETVYGLAANALDTDAVARIFKVKGRPPANPIIVHVADVASAQSLVREWPEAATTLANRFWPGPLTLVLWKSDRIPAIVTAGGPTVGIRIPNHPVPLNLIRRSGLPLAAPSANRSEEVSPTAAEHVVESLGPFVSDLLILDGGPCTVGVESTVLDLTLPTPRVLRPGMISAAQLTEAIGPVQEGPLSDTIARSPGQMRRHYAPRARVCLIPSETPGSALRIIGYGPSGETVERRLPADAVGYAAMFYRTLRELDREGALRIEIQMPPETPEWAAVHDRLRRAAVPKSEASK